MRTSKEIVRALVEARERHHDNEVEHANLVWVQIGVFGVKLNCLQLLY